MPLTTTDTPWVETVARTAAETNECNGHPAGPYDPMGQTVYCDGSCRPAPSREAVTRRIDALAESLDAMKAGDERCFRTLRVVAFPDRLVLRSPLVGRVSPDATKAIDFASAWDLAALLVHAADAADEIASAR